MPNVQLRCIIIIFIFPFQSENNYNFLMGSNCNFLMGWNLIIFIVWFLTEI